jgi:hypothetical protein
MKNFIKILCFVAAFVPLGQAQAYCYSCTRYAVNDMISIHRDESGASFDVESYKIINKPANNAYTTSVTLRDMSSAHMFDFKIQGRSSGSTNVIIELHHSFTHKCQIIIHDSAEIFRPQLFVDTGRCDANFKISSLLGSHGYYFLKVGFHDA